MKKHILFLFIIALFSCIQDIDNSGTQNPSYIGGLDENDQKQFTEKDIPVTQGQNGNTVKLRFYEDMSDVPYISVSDYHKMMCGNTMTVTKTNYGEYKLTNSNGSAVINTKNETFFSEDHLSFINIMNIYKQGMPNIGVDGLAYCRFKSLKIEPTIAPITLNYADCSIDLRGDDENVYFPFTAINDLYSNLECFRACYNGEKIIVISNIFNSDPNGIDPDYYRPIVEKETRSPEMAEFSYNNLCFAFKHYYGYPGSERLENMQTLGLDGALLALGDDGQLIKNLLRSTDMAEYMVGLIFLGYYMEFDKHTVITPSDLLYYDDTFYYKVGQLHNEKLAQSERINSMKNDKKVAKYDNFMYPMAGIKRNRKESYGNSDTYQKKGDTAICILDTFAANEKEFENYNAWSAFYNETEAKPTLEEYPDDPVLILFDSLERASADSDIKNFVIDISANGGGYTDNVAFFTSLIMNKAELSYYNILTGQTFTIYYETDRNLDGKYDASDDEVHYDFNFAVLESACSFSCANLFPSIMKDAGYPILGEKSGGGACSYQKMLTAEGMNYQISSSKCFARNKAGENIDFGIEPTNPLEIKPNKISITLSETLTAEIPDYSNFWDIDLISSEVNKFYKNKQ